MGQDNPSILHLFRNSSWILNKLKKSELPFEKSSSHCFWSVQTISDISTNISSTSRHWSALTSLSTKLVATRRSWTEFDKDIRNLWSRCSNKDFVLWSTFRLRVSTTFLQIWAHTEKCLYLHSASCTSDRFTTYMKENSNYFKETLPTIFATKTPFYSLTSRLSKRDVQVGRSWRYLRRRRNGNEVRKLQKHEKATISTCITAAPSVPTEKYQANYRSRGNWDPTAGFC